MPARNAIDIDIARTRLLDAAEELFYEHGIQAVGIDQIRDRSGVSLKRLYQLFNTKDQLIEAYLIRRDQRWLDRLAEHLECHSDPHARILAVFDWLEQWFTEPGFRGCAWINANGELGGDSATVVEQARAHKTHFQNILFELVGEARRPETLAQHLYLLAEGAIASAGVFADPKPAIQARAAAERLLEIA